MKKIIVAIDGHSGCGKSTMAKDLAKKTGYIYIDTGAMYRAVTLYCLQNDLLHNGEIDELKLKEDMPQLEIGFKRDTETGEVHTTLNEKDVEKEIREMEVSQNVSLVSTLEFVRRELVHKQQSMGKEKGIVMDGRDIGTTVFPQAELKVFVTASAQERARRRFDELKAKGVEIFYDQVLQNLEQRDETDRTRAISPLKKADDALLLDNTNMSRDEQLQWLMEAFNRATAE